MIISSKQGDLDNIITFKHVCDIKEDMNNIDSNQITIGTICTVIKDEDGKAKQYVADSDKIWHLITNHFIDIF